MERLLISKEGLRYDIIYNLINYIGNSRRSVRASYDFDDVVFDTRGEADEVLSSMDELMDRYIKGMAVYKDDKDFPPGVDVIFNTNKSKSVPKLEVLKDVKPDPDNPFGSLIKDADQGGQYWYTDKNGKKKLGLINKLSD